MPKHRFSLLWQQDALCNTKTAPLSNPLHPSLTGIETMDFYAKLKKQPLKKNIILVSLIFIGIIVIKPALLSDGLCSYLNSAQPFPTLV